MCGFDKLVLHDLDLVGFLDYIQDHFLLLSIRRSGGVFHQRYTYMATLKESFHVFDMSMQGQIRGNLSHHVFSKD